MKSKKLKLSIVIVCLAILIGLITWAVKSVAVDVVDYQFKILNLRPDSNLGYRILRVKADGSDAGSKVKVWNIVKSDGGKDEELPLYCVQAELGFSDSDEEAQSGTVTYDKMFDMKLIGDKTELNNSYGTSNLIIANTDNSDIYSKVLWVADNMYVPDENTTAEDKINFLRNAGVIPVEDEYTLKEKASLLVAGELVEKTELQELAGYTQQQVYEYIEDLSVEELEEFEKNTKKLFYSEYYLSDDVIEVVQQLVLWNIIHSKDEDASITNSYCGDVLATLYYAEGDDAEEDDAYDVLTGYKPITGVTKENMPTVPFSDAILGKQYQENGQKLYEYLLGKANENENAAYYDVVKYSDRIEYRVPVKLNSNVNTVKVDETSDEYNYIVGPYEIERISKRDFDLITTVSVDNYKILDASKENEIDDIKSVVGAEKGKYQFYLSIPKTEGISDLSFEFTATSNNRIVNLFLGANAQAEQPIILVENNPATETITIGVNDKKFDLALRKVITGVRSGEAVSPGDDKILVDINGEANARKVDIDTTNLNKVVDGNVITTATYNHRKEPVLVETGDIVTYSIRIYNEGEVEGRATIVADVIPDGLEFKRVVSGKYKKLETPPITLNEDKADNYIFFEKISNENLNPFDAEKQELYWEEIVIECTVTAKAKKDNQILTNIALIFEAYNEETGTTITNQEGVDRDSEPYTVPDEAVTAVMENYEGNNNDDDLSQDNYFYKGQQDDDDFEKLVLKGANLDLALRKFITEVESKDNAGNATTKGYDRAPIVDVEKLNTYDTEGNLITTAEYNHPKTPVTVKVGDIVTYTIRVYNEGELDGYVAEVTDNLPKWLEFLPEDKINKDVYLWEYAEEGNTRTVVTRITAKDSAAGQELYGTEGTDTYRKNGQLLKAYDPETMETLDYIDVKIRCKVVGTIDEDTLKPGEKVTNIAVITGKTDETGEEVKSDRDSTCGYENLPSDENLPSYKDEEINSGIEYIPGQEDDDDFEKVVIEVFDLALRKFITSVDDGKEVISYGDSRKPEISKGTEGRDLDYTHPKNPIGVQNGNLVTYTIRIFNEGDIDGYAKQVIDVIPDGLQFHSATVNGEDYRWEMYKEVTDSSEVDFEYKGKKYAKTTNKEEATVIKTDYLSKAQEDETKRDNLLKAFDKEDFEKNGAIDNAEKRNPDYRDLKVTCLVTEPNTSTRVLTNVAEIFEDEDQDGNEVDDEDSTPGNNESKEDDIDYDSVKLLYFDLALRKFITEVEGTPVNNRYPEVKPGTEGRDLDYKHTKVPVELVSGNTVIYTIRVYNEGANAGYASEVMDDLPDGILFLPEHQTNIDYRWVLYKESKNGTYEYADKKYEKTNNPEEADIAITDYLDKEVSGRDSLIKPFDKEDFEKNGAVDTAEKKNPDYRDIKIAFKVTEPNSSDRIIDNTAEITRDEDEDGNEVKDKDSTPGNNESKEDDIDKEYIKVKEFDLALLKWVSKVSVTQDGKTKVTETGHTAETSKKEPPVMVTIDSKKVDSVVVKFIYDIRVENQGEIEGYVKEVKDHIPEGLKFDPKDNPDWKQVDEKTITTDKLKDTLLKPKETATVQVVLTWINGSKNLNLKTNYAEISEDYNEWGVPDKDSKPNDFNGTPKDDDEDDAPVLLTLKTGQMPKYFILGFTILAVLIGGIYLIRKYVYRI